MPKTLQGVDRGKYTGKTTVPVAGDDRNAENIETPIQTLLDDAANLLAQLTNVADALGRHSHSLATEATPGFMSEIDKQRLNTFSAQLASHSHAIASTTTPGFMASADVVKLLGVEKNAQVVTLARVNSALGVVQTKKVLPGSTFAAGAVKVFTINMPGVSSDDCVISSQYMENEGEFSLMYRCAQDAVLVFVKNLTLQSRNFTPGEITVKVLSS